jgi:hypothetical protein
MQKLSAGLDEDIPLDREQINAVWRETRLVHDNLNKVIDRILESPVNKKTDET